MERGVLLQNPAILLAQEPPLRILDKTVKKELQIRVPRNMGNNILIWGYVVAVIASCLTPTQKVVGLYTPSGMTMKIAITAELLQ